MVYTYFGSPETEKVRTRGGAPCGPGAPAELVGAIDNARLADASLLQENIVVIDFGQSYNLANRPEGYQPGTVLNYQSPEARFDGRAGMEADVWALGCAIFEIRAGMPLFEPFFASDTDILRQTVEVLGRLPDPWWSSFEERNQWFEENGEPKSAAAGDQERAGVFIRSSKSSIQQKLRSIGTQDEYSSADDGPIMEKPGVKLEEEEVRLLGDLLEKMLKYDPEERITIQEVLAHPWFDLS